MSTADVAEVLAIEKTAYSHPWTHGNFIDSIAAGYLAEVLVVDGELVGYFVAMVGVEELHLLNITVAPRLQRRGLGRLLLAAVQAHGRHLALETLWLEVRAGNHRARALYRDCGMAEIGLRRSYYPAVGGREDAVVMRMALNRAPGAAQGAGDAD
ncbi:Ribosomal-protein-alanine acetyltransferase [Rubrivivax sp. A210]|uniref:ribosomal protein S18-alanine N-acetyltransferase n=1 Tax=Rubrivivax sp. A210 TaxID=2772301 RepID=UPI00191837EA|nr:ribosomal protein S18-alanine N-acetyltransferase [Rubrivivax sp. A210]CAD5374184.1 Ribosomal-protein-alanine acetyltransferase [Rubrivivax sp. A210]